MPTRLPAPGARELFRYARVVPPRIVDLSTRWRSYRAAEDVTPKDAPSANTQWAEEFIRSSDYMDDLSRVDLKLHSLLKKTDVPEDRLPSREVIVDSKAFEQAVRAEREQLAAIKRRLTLSLTASALLGRKDEMARQSRALQWIELLPTLSKTTKRRAYAPVVLERSHKDGARKADLDTRKGSDGPNGHTADVNSEKPAAQAVSSRDVLAAWSIADDYIERRRDALDDIVEQIKHRSFATEATEATDGPVKKAAPSKREREERRRRYQAHTTDRIRALKAANAESKRLANAPVRVIAEEVRKSGDYLAEVENSHGKGSTEVVARMAMATMATYGKTFPDAYGTTKDTEDGRTDSAHTCVYESANPCVELLAADVPAIKADEDVRPLGIAELIRVEERWMAYLPGEISAIENVLKGERRRKKVTSTKVFEEVTERLTQEMQEGETQTQSTTKQDLSSQVESEIVSRLATDVNASANASGGGTIGVVNLEGGASLGAGIQLGIDTSLSSTTESEFSQEIISKAVERTKKATSELRRTRSYQLFETTNRHEIDNTLGDHTNGIYCFLDKKVCITERVYGLRQFLAAELLRPGTDLVQKEANKQLLNLYDLGVPPTFDLSPTDVSPENYLHLVGRLRATNVTPPPPAVKMISKTYKTDITNESREPTEFTPKQIAEVLTPFFGKYKRFLMQDNIQIPEGYAVQSVRVTVTHGSNGISLPAHLPLAILGSTIFALPTLSVASVPPYTFFYMPLAIWQVLYTASPIMHYNADSSNVTINIAHQTKESPYFFFEPDFLIREFLDALGNSFVMTDEFVEFLRGRLEGLYNAFTSTTNNGVIDALTDMNEATRTEINRFVTDVQAYLGQLVTSVIPSLISGGSASSPTFPAIPSLDPDVVRKIPEAILKPFKEFFDAIIAHIQELVEDSIGNLFEMLLALSDNTDTKVFTGATGLTDVLPVSFNCVSLKPGVTINLTVSMIRKDEIALDAWRLETFERLNQAYYQLVADYETRRNSQLLRPAFRSSPGLMRIEELEVIKRRVIRALHRKYYTGADANPTLDELRLFEHAIDWENVTFRLYSYGPNGSQVAYEKLGFFDSADERRKQFMNATWAQVLIPLREDRRLEQVMIDFLQTGSVHFEAELLAQLGTDGQDPLNELTEIYRDLVLQRENLPDVEPTYREEVIPTELTIIYLPGNGAPYPVNPIGCA